MTVFAMVSVYDQVAKAWMPPRMFQSEAAAVRSFTDAINDKQNAIGMHPEDYVLFNVGEFNDENGDVDGLVHGPEKIVNGLACLQERMELDANAIGDIGTT